MKIFDAKVAKNAVVSWIRTWFEENGKDCNAVIGISGGKDSTIAAALCVEALGKERVIGVLMPNIKQDDIDDSYTVCDLLQIRRLVVPITLPVGDILGQIEASGVSPSRQAIVNLPARIRMATLYAVSQSLNGRVVNTCNLSEDWVGYSTRWGDSVGDFCPIAKFTLHEVKAIGHELGLPPELINKTPSDGLCGKTDEENLGFTYDVLDEYLRTGRIDNLHDKRRIDEKHAHNQFKLAMPPCYEPNIPICASDVIDQN